MASLKDTKRRIGSVKNTQKITRAMKLVSSAKYARANTALLKGRPYSKAFDNLSLRVLSQASHPLLSDERKERSALFILVATDRGLCGALNSNLIKLCLELVRKKQEEGVKVFLACWGRKAVNAAKSFPCEVIEKKEKVTEKPTYAFSAEKAQNLAKKYLAKEVDVVYLAYPEFKNAMTQRPKIERLLPLEREKEVSASTAIFEPEQEKIIDYIVQKKVANQLYSALMESQTSEHAARMTAMDSATTNADKVIKDLTLEYNRARQAAITKELIEITSGAEALN